MSHSHGSYPYRSATYGTWDAKEDRDLSRAAAERYLMLQALPEPQPASSYGRVRSGLRRLIALSAPRVTGARRAEA